ncbi:MAG TPA: adenylate kinase [Anaerolineales bacterium]|nr:adenylate kinase [Anaerolineales bacterium]
MPFPYRRLSVVGTSGFGKSTLAEKLAHRLKVTFVELDALHWEPGWKPAEITVFRRRVDEATREPGWAVAGNYSRVRDIIWARAQAVVWLDYPFGIGLWRLVKRTLLRAVRREELWNGNRDLFYPHLKFWSDESLIVWYFKTYGRRKREYPQLFSLPEYAHLNVIHLRTPQDADSWLENLSPLSKVGVGDSSDGQ